MQKLLTKANINDYLVNFIGLESEEVAIMPHYVKIDIVKDDLESFIDYINHEEG